MEVNYTQRWISVLEVIGVLILLPLVGYLIYEQQGELFRTERRATTPVPTSPPVELWDAYEKALAVAKAHAEDAQLVSASTQWQAADKEALLAGSPRWSFTFYTAADGQILDITVEGERANFVKATKVWEAPPLLSGERWRFGPGEALLVFLAYGGEDFLTDHPKALTDLHLGPDSEGRTVWNVVAFDSETQALCSVTIDAATWQVLEHHTMQRGDR